MRQQPEIQPYRLRRGCGNPAFAPLPSTESRVENTLSRQPIAEDVTGRKGRADRGARACPWVWHAPGHRLGPRPVEDRARPRFVRRRSPLQALPPSPRHAPARYRIARADRFRVSAWHRRSPRPRPRRRSARRAREENRQGRARNFRQIPPRRCCSRSEEHTSELQSHVNLVCRLLLEKKKKNIKYTIHEKKNKQENTIK